MIVDFSYSQAEKAKTGWSLVCVQSLLIKHLDKWGNRSFIFKKHPELGAALANYFSTMECQERYMFVDRKIAHTHEQLDLESPRRKIILKSLLSILSLMPSEIKEAVDQYVQRLTKMLATLESNSHSNVSHDTTLPSNNSDKWVLAVLVIIIFVILASGSIPSGPIRGMEPP
jgi:hypothetical protein